MDLSHLQEAFLTEGFYPFAHLYVSPAWDIPRAMTSLRFSVLLKTMGCPKG